MEGDFEGLVAELYIRLGHKIERRVKRTEHTVDLLISASNGERWVVRCALHGEFSRLELHDFLQVLHVEQARQAAIVSVGFVSPEIRQAVSGLPMQVLDAMQFQRLLAGARELAFRDTPTASRQVSSIQEPQDQVSPGQTGQPESASAPVPVSRPSAAKPPKSSRSSWTMLIVIAVPLALSMCIALLTRLDTNTNRQPSTDGPSSSSRPTGGLPEQVADYAYDVAFVSSEYGGQFIIRNTIRITSFVNVPITSELSRQGVTQAVCINYTFSANRANGSRVDNVNRAMLVYTQNGVTKHAQMESETCQ